MAGQRPSDRPKSRTATGVTGKIMASIPRPCRISAGIPTSTGAGAATTLARTTAAGYDKNSRTDFQYESYEMAEARYAAPVGTATRAGPTGDTAETVAGITHSGPFGTRTIAISDRPYAVAETETLRAIDRPHAVADTCTRGHTPSPCTGTDATAGLSSGRPPTGGCRAGTDALAHVCRPGGSADFTGSPRADDDAASRSALAARDAATGDEPKQQTKCQRSARLAHGCRPSGSDNPVDFSANDDSVDPSAWTARGTGTNGRANHRIGPEPSGRLADKH